MEHAWGERLPTLTTPRVELRAARAGDEVALFELFSDREVARYWSSPAWTEPDQARAYLADIAEGFRTKSLFQWMVAERETGRVVGTCTLYRWDREHRRAEIGCALAPSRWGRGLMREALTALLDFAFDALGLDRLGADVDPRNARSLALFEGLGFAREGLLREHYRVGGEVQDSVLLGLLAREWRRARGGPRARGP